MSELISGKEALIALANGDEVQGNIGYGWCDIKDSDRVCIKSFTTELNLNGIMVKFRLKPRTITINGIEVPANFEPKDGDKVWFLDDDSELGYGSSMEYGKDIKSYFGWWRTEEEIKQVFAALRSIFK